MASGVKVTDPTLIIHSQQDNVVPIAFSQILLTRMCAAGNVVERRVLPQAGGHVAAALHGEGCEAVITEAAQTFVAARTLSGIRAAQQHFSNSEELARLERWHGKRARWVLDGWTGVWLAFGHGKAQCT